MVNIFGIKLFGGSSMHHKSRRHNYSNKRRNSRRHLNGGYTYDNAGSPEDDITSRLSSVLSATNSKSKSNSKKQTKGKGTRKYSNKAK
jgi:hypothetical protein